MSRVTHITHIDEACYTYEDVHVCAQVCIRVCVRICCTNIYMYIYMYMCVYVYIRMGNRW